MTGSDVFTGCLMLAPRMQSELSRLRAALPGYEVIVTRCGCAGRFKAVRRPGGFDDAPWRVISADAADLGHELAPGTSAAQAAMPRLPARPKRTRVTCSLATRRPGHTAKYNRPSATS